MMKLLDADELCTKVFVKVGLKVDTDDPAIKDMLIQQAILAAVLENFQMWQTEQIRLEMERFQAVFTETAAPVIAAAKELRQQKLLLLAEILQTNTANLDKVEGKLAGILHQHMEQERRVFLGSLKTLLLKAGAAYSVFWLFIAMWVLK